MSTDGTGNGQRVDRVSHWATGSQEQIRRGSLIASGDKGNYGKHNVEKERSAKEWESGQKNHQHY